MSPLPAKATTVHPVPYPELQGHISADEDATSDYGSSFESDLTSLKSSILNYVYENGRRYHSYQSGKYFLPNDETEQDRLDLHHHCYLLLLDGNLTMAPIKKGIQKVLDIGTGTGIWAIDCADEYPSAEVIGTDLSPIQPSWVPPNCRFEVDDAENTWLYPKNSFDFIHCRNLAQSIRDWPKLIKNWYEHTIPGGWVEWVENEPRIRCDDGTLPKDAAVVRLLDIWDQSAEKTGLPQPKGSEMKKLVEEAGFVDVQFYAIKQPFNTWPSDKKLKIVGRANLALSENVFHAYNLAMLTRVYGMDPDDANKLCDGARSDIFNRRHHTYCIAWYVIGRKPLDDEGFRQ